MKDILIIEDKNKLLNKSINIHIDNALIQEPMSITDIEEWEEIVIRMQIPYVLAQLTVKAFGDDPDGIKSKKSQWKTGYMIFLRKEDLSQKFSFIDDLPKNVASDDGEDEYKVLHFSGKNK